MALVSIVLPAYNEKENIENAARTLSQVLQPLPEEYELLFISDGSKDGTYEEILRVAKKNPHVKGAEFSRNFGKEAAIFAGLELAAGDAVVVMDCDLQHPPSVLPEMLEKWRGGAEVVEGIKSSRGRESLGYKLSAGLFYRIMSALIHMDMKASSDYKLLDRKVVAALLELPERRTFFRALSFWVGFKRTELPYRVQARPAGESKWSTRALIRYAIRNIGSFSSAPLQIVTALGLLMLVTALVFSLVALVQKFTGVAIGGFTTVIVLLLFTGSLIMISLGIIGFYLARIYEELKGRPRYIISETCSREDGE